MRARHGRSCAACRRLSEYEFDDVRDYVIACGISSAELDSWLRPPKNGNGASPRTGKTIAPPWKARTFAADQLQTMTFAPLNYLLPGLVPEGLCLLVSRPKLGKSWLALDLAIATAAGRFVLGQLKPASGEVLYAALEDGPDGFSGG